MEKIKGTLKLLNSDTVFNNVECEYEFDSYNGIKGGIFPNLLTNISKFRGKKFFFRNDDIVMSIYVNQITNNTIHFQTIRFKSILNESNTNGLVFFITQTELFHEQKLNIEGEELTLCWYGNFSAIEFNATKIDSNIIRKFKHIAENVLLYLQLLQTQHCKIIGYKYNKCLYIDYSQDNFKPYKYPYALTFTKEHAEQFITRFIISQFKDYLTKIIYRLISAKNAPNIEMKCVWLIFALEAIESVYNMKKRRSIKKDKNHIYFNNIVDELFPSSDLIKVYFDDHKYWKPLLLDLSKQICSFFKKYQRFRNKTR